MTQRAQKITRLLVLMHRAAYRRDDDGTLYYADKTPPAPIKGCKTQNLVSRTLAASLNVILAIIGPWAIYDICLPQTPPDEYPSIQRTNSRHIHIQLLASNTYK